MGGPMGAYDEADHPWLVDERLLREAVEADVPVWGVCLGAQLLASALGARVYRGERPEVGALPVELMPAAADDPVFGDAPSSFPTLQWHGDSFDLPDGATLLAGSPTPTDTRRSGSAVPTGSSSTSRSRLSWPRSGARCPPTQRASEATLGPGALERLLAGVEGNADTTLPLARSLFGRWLEAAARRRLPAQVVHRPFHDVVRALAVMPSKAEAHV